jgi:hypothetical protein
MNPEELLGLTGLACAIIAATAWIAERRRLRRRDLDRVGWVPWTMLFFWALLAAVVLLALAAKARLAG